MKCDEVRQFWNLFHDSEGDAELNLQINEHLEMCPRCSRWFFEQSQLEDCIARDLKGNMTPTASLWEGIESQVTSVEPAKSSGWLLAGVGVVGLAACLLIVISLGVFRPHDDVSDLARHSVALHDKLVTGEEDVSFVSESHVDVENYLRTQVSFPVRCPPREDAGFDVRGGGTCKLANDRVAYVVGHVAGQDVSLFILPRDSVPSFPRELTRFRERKRHRRRMGNSDVLMREIDRNLVVVVGRAGPNQLERLLNAYGTYGHGNSTPHQDADHT